MVVTVKDPPAISLSFVNDGSVQRSRVTSLTLQFNLNVSASLDLTDIVLRNLTTGASIDSSSLSLSFDTTSNKAVLTFPGLAARKLPDGNYQLTVLAAGVISTDGFHLTVDYSFNLFVLTGDVNGDRITNDLDLYLVWQNLLQPAALRNLAQDLDGDGQITNADVAVVKSNYLATLPVPPNFAPSSRIALVALEAPAASTTTSIAVMETQPAVDSNTQQSPPVAQTSSSGAVGALSNAEKAGTAPQTAPGGQTALEPINLREFVSNQSVPLMVHFLRPPGAEHLDSVGILEWLRPAHEDSLLSLGTLASEAFVSDHPSGTHDSHWCLPQSNPDTDEAAAKNIWHRLSRRNPQR